MFTGIIEETGTVKAIHRGAKSVTLEVQAAAVMEGTQVGDSIATNGVCLTVTTLTGKGFTADVMPQTMRATALGSLRPGSAVNLERALTLSTRLGGHIVSGHVDGTGRIVKREQEDTALWLWIEAPANIMRYVIEKGSITVQGVSLTVAKVQGMMFAVSLIPHTQGATTLHSAKVGDVVNLENDVIAKYVEKFCGDNGNSDDTVNLYRNFMMNK
ncbi:MAG: riboflavin synthase [Prevotella sp.]|nr:riboflavin synthase [Candidatus Prevotella equi]